MDAIQLVRLPAMAALVIVFGAVPALSAEVLQALPPTVISAGPYGGSATATPLAGGKVRVLWLENSEIQQRTVVADGTAGTSAP